MTWAKRRCPKSLGWLTWFPLGSENGFCFSNSNHGVVTSANATFASSKLRNAARYEHCQRQNIGNYVLFHVRALPSFGVGSEALAVKRLIMSRVSG